MGLIYGSQCDKLKPVFVVSDEARLKPVSSATETSYKIGVLLEASLEMKLSKIANNILANTPLFVVHKHPFPRERFSRAKAYISIGLH